MQIGDYRSKQIQRKDHSTIIHWCTQEGTGEEKVHLHELYYPEILHMSFGGAPKTACTLQVGENHTTKLRREKQEGFPALW